MTVTAKINIAGSYKVSLKIIDRELFAATHEGKTALKFKSVERWFNDDKDMADLFARMASQGIEATLGRFVGR